jgi:recombination protein RecT
MTELAKTQQSQQMPATLKSILGSESIKNRFNELLGKKAPGFISSIINVSQSNKLLAKADPKSIISSAVVAASLDLPIDKNLGFAWIVPYGNQAQFQMGYKGFIQLSLRTGQYHKLNVIEVHSNQFKSFNRMTEELDCDFSIEGNGTIVGYVCYFKLVNGFEKTVYWTIEKVKLHGKRYSKSFTSGPWVTDFDEMAKKTVLKNALSKWGIMSIEMQKATISDQAVINYEETEYTESVEYVDNYTDAEIVKEEQKQGLDEKTNAIVEKLKAKKAVALEHLKVKDLAEAREFFEKTLGVIGVALTDENIHKTAADHNFEIVITK